MTTPNRYFELYKNRHYLLNSLLVHSIF